MITTIALSTLYALFIGYVLLVRHARLREVQIQRAVITQVEEIRCRQIAVLQKLFECQVITTRELNLLGDITDETKLARYIEEIVETRKQEAQMTETNLNLSSADFLEQLKRHK